MEPERPPPDAWFRGNPWIWLLALGVLVLVGLVVLLVAVQGEEAERAEALVAVPNVVGMQEDEAVARLRDEGLEVAVQRRAVAATEGEVIDQSPDPGAEVEEAATVTIVVSEGEVETETVTVTEEAEDETATVPVPDLVGMNYVDAHEAAEESGLIADSRPVESDEPRGIVVAQTPSPGTEVATTRHVEIGVSIGPDERPVARVPDVTGPKEERARRIAIETGFTVRTADRDAPTGEEVGEVILQRPAAGTEAAVLTQITIFVGR